MLNASQSKSLFRYKIKLLLFLEKAPIFSGKRNVRRFLRPFLDKLFEKEVDPKNIINVSNSLHIFKNVKDAAYFFLFLMCDLIHDTSVTLMKAWTGWEEGKDKPIDLLIGFVWNLYSVHPAAMAVIMDFIMTDDKFEEDTNRALAVQGGKLGSGSGIEKKMLTIAKGYIPGKNYYDKIPVSRSRSDYSVIFDQSSKGTVTTVSQTRTSHIVLGLPVDADKGLTQPDNASSSLQEVVYMFMRDHSYNWLISMGESDLAEYMYSQGACTKKNKPEFREAILEMFNKFVFNTASSWMSQIKLEIQNLGTYDIFTNIYELTEVRLVKASIQQFSYYPTNNKKAWMKLQNNTEKLQVLQESRGRNAIKRAVNNLMKTNINNPPSGFSEGFPLSASAAESQPKLQGALLKTITDLNLMYYARAVSKTKRIGLARYATGDRSAAAVCIFLNNTARRKPAVNNVNAGEPGFPYIFEENKVAILASRQTPVTRRTLNNVPTRVNSSRFSSNRFNVPAEIPRTLMGSNNLQRENLNKFAQAQAQANAQAAEMNAVLRGISKSIPKGTTLNLRKYIQLLSNYEKLRNNNAKKDLLVKTLKL